MPAGSLKQFLPAHLPELLKPWRAKLEASPLGYRLVRGAFWSLVGMVLSRALNLLAAVLVARLLGRDQFGELGMVQSTVGMFGSVAGFGMGLTATKFVAELRAAAPAKAGRIIALSSLVTWVSGLVMAGGLIAFAPWLARRTLAAPQLSPLLQISSLLLLFGAVNGAQTGALSGFEAFKRIAWVNLWAGLGAFPITVLGTWFWGMTGALWALVLAQALSCGLNFLVLRQEAARAGIVVDYLGCLQERAILWRFSLPGMLSGLVMAPLSWAANVLLVNQSAGYAEMGVLNAAKQWQTVVLFLPNILAQVILPLFSSTVSSNRENSDFHKALTITQSLMVLTAFPLCTGLMFYAEWLLRLYGKAFTGGDLVIVGLMLGTMLQCIGTASGPALQAKGRMWFGVSFNIFWGVTYLLASVWLARPLGGAGLAFASAIATFLLTIWGFLCIRADLPPGLLGRVFPALAAAPLVAGLVVVTPRSWRVIVGLPATLLVTGITLRWLTGASGQTAVLLRSGWLQLTRKLRA